MSLRIDTSEWISGALLIGDTGLGIVAETITANTATGDSGPGLLYQASLDPVNAGKELRVLVLTPPSDGDLFVNEDGSFTLLNAPNGYYYIERQSYANGELYGSPVTTEFYVGVVSHAATGTLSATSAAVAGTSAQTRSHAAEGDISAGSATVAGISARGSLHESTGAISSGSASVSGTASRAATHAATGAISAQSAHIAGVSLRIPSGAAVAHDATGALVAGEAVMMSDAIRNVFGSGRVRTTQTYSIRPTQTAARRPSNLN